MAHDDVPEPHSSTPGERPDPADSNRDEELRRVADRFREFARRDTRFSPVYEKLTLTIAERPDLLDIVMVAPPTRRIPNLILAAVHAVLAAHPDSPLTAYYATLGGTHQVDDELPETFVSFVEEHRREIEQLVATRDTQTNEVLRLPQLRPAFGWVAAQDNRQLALIEVGASAGLLLFPDAYRYAYAFDDGGELYAGDPEAPVLRCPAPDTEADALEPYVSQNLVIRTRTGIDRNPLDPTDPATRDWLRALIWADEVERLERLDMALDVTKRHSRGNDRPRLLAGDALDLLTEAVEAVPDDRLPVVFVSNVLAHFDAAARSRFAALVLSLAAKRDLALIVKEFWEAGLGLFIEPSPASEPDSDAEPYESLGVLLSIAGALRVVDLGRAGYHGAWLRWAPTEVESSRIRALS
jgi:hypothetical protein